MMLMKQTLQRTWGKVLFNSDWLVRVLLLVLCAGCTVVAQGQCNTINSAKDYFETEAWWQKPDFRELQFAVGLANNIPEVTKLYKDVVDEYERGDKTFAKSAIDEVYRKYKDSDKPANNLIDGMIGPDTIKQFVVFCKKLNFPDGSPSDKKFIEALQKFAAITVNNPKWHETITGDDFISWAKKTTSDTTNEYYIYSEKYERDPVNVFLIANFEESDKGDEASSEGEDLFNSVYVLQADDLEILEMKLNASKKINELYKIPPTVSTPEFRQKIVDELGLDLEEESAEPLIKAILIGAHTIRLFRVSDSAVDLLSVRGAPKELIERTVALQKFSFESKPEIEKQINAIVDELLEDYRDQLNILDQNTVNKTQDGSSEGDGQLQGSMTSQYKRGKLTKAIAGLKEGGDYKNALIENVEEVDGLKFESDKEFSEEIKRLARSAKLAVVKDLDELVGVRFPNGDIFRTALRVSANIRPEQRSLLTTILSLAKDIDLPPTKAKLKPIQLEDAGCGCGAFESLGEEKSVQLYGIYPFWRVLKSGAATEGSDDSDKVKDANPDIDFSLLNRLAYYGVTFDKNGGIQFPLHFPEAPEPGTGVSQKRSNYSDFVRMAHTYKTKVDLVVYNAQWEGWLPVDTDKSDKKVSIDNLITEITKHVSIPVTGLVNRIKPLISFGQSPARTLADGVTLHFDFRDLSIENQDDLFKHLIGREFFHKLREKLPNSKRGIKHFIKGVDYHINLIVPSECFSGHQSTTPVVPKHCRYFSIKNLNELKEFVDLLVVDLSTRPTDTTALSEMKRVRSFIETLPVDNQIHWLERLVPLASMQLDNPEDTSVNDRLLHAKLNYAGFGTWQPSYVKETQAEIDKKLRNVFLKKRDVDGKTTGLRKAISRVGERFSEIEGSVCNFTCPKRWYLRVTIFLMSVTAIVYVIASFFKFSLRELYSTPAFRWVMAGVTAIFFITLWCDPFWSEHQTAILSGTVLIFISYFSISGWRKNRRLP